MDENRRPATLALGEDAEQFRTLGHEPLNAFGPDEALREERVKDVA